MNENISFNFSSIMYVYLHILIIQQNLYDSSLHIHYHCSSSFDFKEASFLLYNLIKYAHYSNVFIHSYFYLCFFTFCNIIHLLSLAYCFQKQYFHIFITSCTTKQYTIEQRKAAAEK